MKNRSERPDSTADDALRLQTRRDAERSPRGPAGESATAACCDPSQRATCCAPEQQVGCCGPAATTCTCA